MAEDSLRLSYRPLSDATPEAEADALATIYRFLLERNQSRKARLEDRTEAVEGGEKKEDSGTTME